MISLALARAERERGVAKYSTGPRQSAPTKQRGFWTPTAEATINSLTTHFQSPLSAHNLQSLLSCTALTHGQVSAGLQERCVPPHVVEALNVWLTDQCDSYSSGRTSAHALPSPFVAGAPDPPLPQSPFGALLRPGHDPIPVPGNANLPVSANSSGCFVIGGPGRGDTLTSPPIQFSKRGPVRLTRFVEMPLDAHCARLNQMVSQGRFEHVGRASIRLEGAIAWGVWLRVNQWSTALENLPLPCGQPHSVFPWSSQGCSQVLAASH